MGVHSKHAEVLGGTVQKKTQKTLRPQLFAHTMADDGLWHTFRKAANDGSDTFSVSQEELQNAIELRYWNAPPALSQPNASSPLLVPAHGSVHSEEEFNEVIERHSNLATYPMWRAVADCFCLYENGCSSFWFWFLLVSLLLAAVGFDAVASIIFVVQLAKVFNDPDGQEKGVWLWFLIAAGGFFLSQVCDLLRLAVTTWLLEPQMKRLSYKVGAGPRNDPISWKFALGSFL